MSRSLRRQILYSALFWSVGLFLGVGLLAAVLLIQHPVQHVAVYGTVRTHWHVLWVPVIVLLAAGLLQLRRALSPLDPLRMRLGAVRARTAVRIEGQYPSEIQPLVDDLNALLEHQEQAVRRAIAKAGDLAHGLKTPLAVLAHEAERARAAGHTELADRIVEQIDRMRRQLDYHLAHARAAASGAAGATASNVAEAVEALVRTMARIHAARPIAFDVSVGAAHVVRVQREDLDEMLGNLLDNACKWTRSTVRVSSETVSTCGVCGNMSTGFVRTSS